MDGPTTVLLIVVLAVGAFMFIAWIKFERAGGGPRTRRRVAERIVVLVLWLAAAIAVPVLGNDNNQPILGALVTGACVLAINKGRQDLRER